MKFMRWLNDKVAKTPEGVMPPKWVMIFYAILFPFNSWYANQSTCHYNFMTDTYTIRGIKIPSELFSHFTRDARNGTIFRTIRDQNGDLTLVKF